MKKFIKKINECKNEDELIDGFWKIRAGMKGRSRKDLDTMIDAFKKKQSELKEELQNQVQELLSEE